MALRIPYYFKTATYIQVQETTNLKTLVLWYFSIDLCSAGSEQFSEILNDTRKYFTVKKILRLLILESVSKNNLM